MQWQEQALCREVDPELFFPDKSSYVDSRQAKRICNQCTVMDECLKAGMFEDFGVWGGTTARERRALRRKMKVAA